MDFVSWFLKIPPNPRRTSSEDSTSSSSTTTTTVSRLSSFRSSIGPLVPSFLNRPSMTRRLSSADAGPSVGTRMLRSSSSPPVTTRKLWKTNAAGFVDREELTRVAKSTGIDARSQSSFTTCELSRPSLDDDCDLQFLSRTSSTSSHFSSEDDTFEACTPCPDPKAFDLLRAKRDSLGAQPGTLGFSPAPPVLSRKLSRLGLDDDCDLPQRIFSLVL
ncbi:hypothetical protein T484DRAFT_1987348 [Baffinella frigidus]|nr:hypothetical protein T484DRAFT_1987348 [Cryptophyta sp. CCMP2293]